MRNNICQRIAFFLAIITICLLFSNCRILQKSKSEFTQKQTSEIEGVKKNSGSTKIDSEFNQEESSIYDFSSSNFSDFFKLNYQPSFDSSGNIIPLIFKHTKNGQTEEFYLSGGNLIGEKLSSSEIKKEFISNKINTKYNSEITYKTHTTYKTITRYNTKVKEKDKTLKDFGFSFWFGIGSTVLIILLLVYKVKFKNSKLKSFIQRVFNGKN